MNDCASEINDCVAVVPSEVCLELVEGTDTTFEFILTDGECNPVNITDDSVKLTVRDYRGGALKIQKTNSPGGHSDPTNGKTEFTIGRNDIDTLTDKQTKWVYEVRRIQAGGEEAVHIEGPFVVDQAVGG